MTLYTDLNYHTQVHKSVGKGDQWSLTAAEWSLKSNSNKSRNVLLASGVYSQIQQSIPDLFLLFPIFLILKVIWTFQLKTKSSVSLSPSSQFHHIGKCSSPPPIIIFIINLSPDPQKPNDLTDSFTSIVWLTFSSTSSRHHRSVALFCGYLWMTMTNRQTDGPYVQQIQTLFVVCAAPLIGSPSWPVLVVVVRTAGQTKRVLFKHTPLSMCDCE